MSKITKEGPCWSWARNHMEIPAEAFRRAHRLAGYAVAAAYENELALWRAYMGVVGRIWKNGTIWPLAEVEEAGAGRDTELKFLKSFDDHSALYPYDRRKLSVAELPRTPGRTGKVDSEEGAAPPGVERPAVDAQRLGQD